MLEQQLPFAHGETEPLQPLEINSGGESHLQLMQEPHTRAGD